MRLTRYFLPILRETPAEAQIASHRLMLRAGMIRQAQAGIYSWLPLGFKVLSRRRADRPRGAAARRPHPAPDADAPVGRAGARAAATTTTAPRCSGSRTATSATCSTDRPTRSSSPTSSARRCPLQGPAADALPHPVEVPRRGPAALRRHARARVPDEGRLQLRPDRRGRDPRLQPPHGHLHPHLRAHGAEGDPDEGRHRPDRRRPQPRVPGAGPDRRERRLLRPRRHPTSTLGDREIDYRGPRAR